jgi:hypothetical protein
LRGSRDGEAFGLGDGELELGDLEFGVSDGVCETVTLALGLGLGVGDALGAFDPVAAMMMITRRISPAATAPAVRATER